MGSNVIKRKIFYSGSVKIWTQGSLFLAMTEGLIIIWALSLSLPCLKQFGSKTFLKGLIKALSGFYRSKTLLDFGLEPQKKKKFLTLIFSVFIDPQDIWIWWSTNPSTLVAGHTHGLALVRYSINISQHLDCHKPSRIAWPKSLLPLG